MRRLPGSLALLLLLSTFPATSAGTADGPDADGAWQLVLGIVRESAGPAHLSLDVSREDADGSVNGNRELGIQELPAGASTRAVEFLPAEGAGRYTVSLLVDGVIADTVAFDVEDAGATGSVVFSVPDEPTYLNLTSDDVNANGKAKSPGEALLTRATIADANGLAELSAIDWLVTRNASIIDSGALPLDVLANATNASLEQRFARTPLEAGAYELTLQARKGGSVVASATRTFTIREIAPTFVSGALANVTPDENVTQHAIIVLSDKNGAAGPGPFEARVYRGSTRVEGAGLLATLGAPSRLADADGAGRSALPLVLNVPAQASAGAYRVSLYQGGSQDTPGALLASLPFDVQALPTLTSVNASTEGGRLALRVNATGEGVITARAQAADGSVVTANTPVAPNATLFLDPPRRGVSLPWTLELRAREAGPVLATSTGMWDAPFDGPALTLTPLHARSRLPAKWALDAQDWPLVGANATFSFTRWDGASEPLLAARLDGGRVRVDGPRDIPAGLYTARVVLRFANGSASEATWSFAAGPWVELDLGTPLVDGRVARVSLQNVGGAPVGRIVIETAPDARVTLAADNTTHVPRGSGARLVFADVSLSPDEQAELRIELPPGPLAAGTRVVPLRVLARVEVA